LNYLKLKFLYDKYNFIHQDQVDLYLHNSQPSPLKNISNNLTPMNQLNQPKQFIQTNQQHFSNVYTGFSGSAAINYKPITVEEYNEFTHLFYINIHSITLMPEFLNKTAEELRYEDYKLRARRLYK